MAFASQPPAHQKAMSTASSAARRDRRRTSGATWERPWLGNRGWRKDKARPIIPKANCPHESHSRMEFRQLRSFVEVVRQGSFTQAAQVRHASQSTISKQVAQLEQSLGVQVLERNGPHVRLTDAGAVVFRRAEEMLRLRRDLLSELTTSASSTAANCAWACRCSVPTRCSPNASPNTGGAIRTSPCTWWRAAARPWSRRCWPASWNWPAASPRRTTASTTSRSATNRWTCCCRPGIPGRCRQRRPRRTGGQPVPALPAELHPQRPPAARLPGGRLQPARRRPQRPGRLPRRAGGGQPGSGAATTGDRSRDRTPGSGAGPAQGAGPALGHRLHLAPWRLPVAGGAGLAGAARAAAGGKPGVGRITASSAEATADNAWGVIRPTACSSV